MRCTLQAAVVGLGASLARAGGAFDASSLVQSPVKQHGDEPSQRKKQPWADLFKGMTGFDEEEPLGEDDPAPRQVVHKKVKKQTKEEMKREGETRKAVKHLIDTIPLPAMVKMSFAGDLIQGFMKYRREMEPEMRLVLDKLVAFKGFKSKTPTGMAQEAAQLVTDCGYPEMGTMFMQEIQTVKTFIFMADVFRVSAGKIAQSGIVGDKQGDPINFASLASAIRDISRNQDLPTVEEPVPEPVLLTKKMFKSGNKEVDDIAAIFDEKAKIPKEWTSAAELAKRAGVTPSNNASAIAETLLWVADARRSDLSEPRLFHELMLAQQDMVSDFNFSLPEPTKRLLDGASEISKSDDVRPLISLFGSFLSEVGFLKQKESSESVSAVMERSLESSANLEQVIGSMGLIMPVVQAFNSNIKTSAPEKVLPALTKLVHLPVRGFNKVSTGEVMRDVSTLFRHVEGIHVMDQSGETSSMDFGTSGVAWADFLDRQAEYKEKSTDDMDHFLPNIAWLTDDLKLSGPGQLTEAFGKIFADTFQEQALFVCNLENVAVRTECEDVPKPVRSQ